MTGLNYRKIRHYASVISDEGFKEDVNLRANMFRQANSILINQERLIANVSVKVAMPSSDSDGKKRGLEKSKSKYTNFQGMVYDPAGKWAPNKIFKSYITETERIQALKTTDPVPNWGWLEKNYPVNSQPSPKGVKVKITEHDVNPRTGEPSKVGVEIKAALGATIREMNPGQNIGSRAAKAFGVIVDALGKFRCPPGTPAAKPCRRRGRWRSTPREGRAPRRPRGLRAGLPGRLLPSRTGRGRWHVASRTRTPSEEGCRVRRSAGAGRWMR